MRQIYVHLEQRESSIDVPRCAREYLLTMLEADPPAPVAKYLPFLVSTCKSFRVPLA